MGIVIFERDIILLYGDHCQLTLAMSAQPDSAPGMKTAQIPKIDGEAAIPIDGDIPMPAQQRKRVVVVGLGMVGIAFM